MPITQKSLPEQDKIDLQILEWVNQGKKGRGVLLERMIEKAIKKGAKSVDEIKKSIADDLS